MSRRPWFAALAIVLVAAGFALAYHPTNDPLPAFAAVAPSSGPAPVTVRYTFDSITGLAVTDVNGRHALRILGQNGGAVKLVPQGAGRALAYPTRCRLARERDCPRAILEGEPDESLNPGRRQLQYGASIRMVPADLSDGANVLQKGYSVGGVSQFKLQVDHRLGHPSCVITGNGRRIYRAEPQINVADGKWHTLTCIRTADKLALQMDGVEQAAVPVPTSLSIANAEPLRVGGKGAGKGNDQFAGEIDNVFLTIG
ncbi:MAG: LamG-like jellyroll fold domain-containing protein [Actinoplanes sp.]